MTKFYHYTGVDNSQRSLSINDQIL